MPLLIGYILSGKNDPKVIDALISYGNSFGWAFQIQDDILDIYGNATETGKKVCGDIIENKNTLLTHYLYKLGSTENKIELPKLTLPKLKNNQSRIKKLVSNSLTCFKTNY